MNCEQVEELLSAYLDNALAPEERLTVAYHVQNCTACSAILADFRCFDTLLFHIPRINPASALREKIFSSPEYLELTSASDPNTGDGKDSPPVKLRDTSSRPQLVALPGGRGRHSSSDATPTTKTPAFRQLTPSTPQRRSAWGLRIMQAAIAVVILLTLAVGSLIGRNLWLQQNNVANNSRTITPPAAPATGGPLSAGMHLVFLQDGKLWSAPADASTQVQPLTSNTLTVAPGWTIRPALPGHTAGDLLAFIDLQQGFVHTIRSDGQRDTTLQQPLLKVGTPPAFVWDTETGAAILNSLTWSKDGRMLAFVADPSGTGLTNLYIFSVDTATVKKVPLPLKGSVSHPTWSPDGIRIAFEFAHNGAKSILDYNTENHGVLTITNGNISPGNPNDTILSLDWSPSSDMPAITWSVGVIGHVHSIWLRHVGVGGTSAPTALTISNYAQAIYSRNGHNGVGSWLLITSTTGHGANLWRIDATPGALPVALTRGKQAGQAQWSPDGTYINYFDTVSADVGTFHIVNVTTGVDTLIATGVTDKPFPAWSTNGQEVVYSTGTQTVIVNLQASKKLLPLKLRGPASTFAWSAISPHQVVVALTDGQQGVYLVDTQHNTSVQLDQHTLSGPIEWTEIP